MNDNAADCPHRYMYYSMTRDTCLCIDCFKTWIGESESCTRPHYPPYCTQPHYPPQDPYYWRVTSTGDASHHV